MEEVSEDDKARVAAVMGISWEKCEFIAQIARDPEIWSSIHTALCWISGRGPKLEVLLKAMMLDPAPYILLAAERSDRDYTARSELFALLASLPSHCLGGFRVQWR